MRIAVSQFAVSADIERNARVICRHIARAAAQDADIVLFPETAMTGYAGLDFPSLANFPWDLLRRRTNDVLASADRHDMWLALGSTHRLTGKSKPHNCVYLINPQGAIVNRYDKRVCTVDDLAHYRPGNQALVFVIQGVRCGLLICHEWRYPELYRQYKQLKVDVILQAWYDGGLSATQMAAEGRVMANVIPSAAQGHAACNHIWICGANTAKRESCFGGFVIHPNGTFAARYPRNRSGVFTFEIKPRNTGPDLAAHARPKVMKSLDHLARPIRDPRSLDRQCL